MLCHMRSGTAARRIDIGSFFYCVQVRAHKQITIEEAPNVLTVHLKRFEFGGFGAKINKKVEFDLELDLQPYMSNKKAGPQVYDLYGVLVHFGHSVNSGHYISYVRGANKVWHLCDDARVSQASERQVLSQSAYILFYIRRHPRHPHLHPRPAPALKAAEVEAGKRKHGDEQEDAAARKKSKLAAAAMGPQPAPKPTANGDAAAGVASGSLTALMRTVTVPKLKKGISSIDSAATESRRGEHATVLVVKYALSPQSKWMVAAAWHPDDRLNFCTSVCSGGAGTVV